MKLYLIRHGQTDWNIVGTIQGSKDVELNSTGISQAEELSKKIVETDYSFSKVYSSHQKRATKTAKILSDTTKTECIEIKGLEEINLGEWEGLSWAEIQKVYPSEFSEWYKNRRNTKPPGGESYQEMLMRVLKTLRKIVDSNEENILIVTHSAVIMCLQCYLTNTPFEEMTKFKTDNMSITEIDSSLIEVR
ncbi:MULTISPECIES: alpha-ribazole phosphatase [Paraliobacillus]|uniref:alpha-ribazole phosphatase n=1 Tax=Paraliobacillus TaxID=200903 RepID=UPI000DD44E35|nr:MULTISPECIES: alpha-ribazole phosphatase [Paraliobacillus]